MGRSRLPLVSAIAVVAAVLLAGVASAHRAGGRPVALVTDETGSEVLAVSLPGGHVLRRVRVAADPETIASEPTGPAIVVSPASHTVTVLAWRSLRPVAVFKGFRSPQIAAITPDGEWVYVTDAATGELSVIELQTRTIVDRVFVGYGAHHVAVSPDEQRAWVVLGESATTIVTLDASTPDRPRVTGRLRLSTRAHDLAFAPDSRSVWVTSATASSISVLDAKTQRLIGIVAAGRAPQHVVFLPYGHPAAFISSGYGSSIEMVDAATRTVIRTRALPYGSFNLATSGDLVVTASLLDGDVTEFNGAVLVRWMNVKVAPRARDVAISVW